jgi:glycosyltransferase involved in cell wall biosynthesis
MTCGTPMVTSRVNGLEELAGDAALLVDPGDSGEIADAALRVLCDPAVSARLRTAGLARSRIFSWDACARHTLDILEQAARRASASAAS